MIRRAVTLEIVSDEAADEPPEPRPLPLPELMIDDSRPATPVERPHWRVRLLELPARIRPSTAFEFVLLALLALQCARLFWAVVTPLGPVGAWTAPIPAAPRPSSAPAALDFDPFFRIEAQTGPVVVTSLNLTLHGVREDRATGRGSAIIGTPDGAQGSYAVGEEIIEGVTLIGVAFDSATISRNGASEQIFMGSGPAGNAGQSPTSAPQQAPVPSGGPPR